MPFVEAVPRNPYSFKNLNRRKIPSSGPKVLRQFPRNAMPIVVVIPGLQRCPISTANAFEKNFCFFSESSATVVRFFIRSTLANSLFSAAQCRDELRFRCGSVSKVFRQQGASTRFITFSITVATATLFWCSDLPPIVRLSPTACHFESISS